MRAIRIVASLTVAALLGSCQSDTDSHTDALAPSSTHPSSLVIRDRFEDEGFLVHTIPDRGIAFTVGNLTPVADFPECGGSGGLAESDAKIFLQQVITPAGPIKALDRITGTFVVYDAVLPMPQDFCLLATAPIIGSGRGKFTRTDNSLTGVGPGINSFGLTANAVLELTDGGRALFHVVARLLFDGVNEPEVIVDNVEFKPIGH